MNQNISNRLFPLFMITIMCLSCKKFVEIPIPKNQLLTESVFTDSVQANSAVVGNYIFMMQNFSLVISNGGLTAYTALSSDEIILTTGTDNEFQFLHNEISTQNSINGTLWSYAYSIIYKVNTCIEGLEASSHISQTARKQLIAECKLLRAFIYFNLVNLYGEVPLVIASDYHMNQSLSRTPVNMIYEQIIKDLLSAQNSLPLIYLTKNRMRPNKHTATALLSKVYLYNEEWNKAEIEANKIIDEDMYELEHDINSVFTIGSKETIWAMQTILPTRATMEGYNFIPLSLASRPKFSLTSHLVNAFESGDQRGKVNNWVKFNTIGGQHYFYPYKYKQRFPTMPATENYVIFRLPEQYLIRAEARLNQSKFIEAVDDINKVRNRASLPSIPYSIDQSEIMNAIIKERYVELFCEWGNRWFDIKRWNLATTILEPLKADWQSKDKLYPIPQNELNNNPNLIQNPGY